MSLPLTILSLTTGAFMLTTIVCFVAWRGADRSRMLYKQRWERLVRREARQFQRQHSRQVMKLMTWRN